MQISKTFATNFPVRYVLQYVNQEERTSSQTLISILFSKLYSAISSQQRGIKIKQQTHHLACFHSGQLYCYTRKSVKCQYQPGLISRNIMRSKNTGLRYLAARFCTFFHVRSVIHKARDNGTMIAILDSTKNGDEI